jgi:hypothetical protein
MNKKFLALFTLFSLSSSMLAYAHTVEYKTEARGVKGDFTTSYTNPLTGQSDVNLNGGSAQFIFQEVPLQPGQKLVLTQKITKGPENSVSLCMITIDKKVVVHKIAANGQCSAEYIVKSN